MAKFLSRLPVFRLAAVESVSSRGDEAQIQKIGNSQSLLTSAATDEKEKSAVKEAATLQPIRDLTTAECAGRDARDEE